MATLEKVNLREVGSAGLKQYGGIIIEDPAVEFTGRQWRETLRQMAEGDPVIGAVLAAITMLIRDATWDLTPANDTRRAAQVTAFVQSCFDDMEQDFDQTLDEILSFVTYGWSYFEVVYKDRRGPTPGARRGPGGGRIPPPSQYSDGKIGWHRFAPRPQDTLLLWQFDPQGNLQGMIQQAPPSYIPTFLPIGKALLFRAKVAKNNPEGRALLKNAWRPWYFKRNMENIEAIGIERDLNGYPIFEIPAAMLHDDADEQTKQTVTDLLEMLKNIKRDNLEGAIIPQERDEKGNKLIEFRLMSSGSQRAFNTDAIIARYDQRISMSLLADMILLGHERVGSYALSATKADLFMAFLNGLLGSIAGVLNRQAIAPLLRYNNLDPRLAPGFAFNRVKELSPQLFADAVTKLAAAGMAFFPSRANEDFIYDILGMVPPPVGDRPTSTGVVTPLGGAAGPGAGGQAGDGGPVPPGDTVGGPDSTPDLVSPADNPGNSTAP